MAKSLNHEINVTLTYKINVVTRSVKLNKYPKYNAYLLDRARDTMQKSLDHVIQVKARCGSCTEMT